MGNSNQNEGGPRGGVKTAKSLEPPDLATLRAQSTGQPLQGENTLEAIMRRCEERNRGEGSQPLSKDESLEIIGDIKTLAPGKTDEQRESIQNRLSLYTELDATLEKARQDELADLGARLVWASAKYGVDCKSFISGDEKPALDATFNEYVQSDRAARATIDFLAFKIALVKGKDLNGLNGREIANMEARMRVLREEYSAAINEVMSVSPDELKRVQNEQDVIKKIEQVFFYKTPKTPKPPEGMKFVESPPTPPVYTRKPKPKREAPRRFSTKEVTTAAVAFLSALFLSGHAISPNESASQKGSIPTADLQIQQKPDQKPAGKVVKVTIGPVDVYNKKGVTKYPGYITTGDTSSTESETCMLTPTTKEPKFRSCTFFMPPEPPDQAARDNNALEQLKASPR